MALEARLTELATTAADEPDAARARQLGAAVVGLRTSLDREGAAAGAGSAEAMGAVQQAHRQLQETLRILGTPDQPAG